VEIPGSFFGLRLRHWPSPICSRNIWQLRRRCAVFWVMASLGAGTYVVVVVVLFLAGIFICDQTARDTAAVDPGFIVYDEIVGFLVAMYLLPQSGDG